MKALVAVLLALAMSSQFANATPPLEELHRNAEAGDLFAQLVLGGMYFRGDALPQNYEQSARWYLMAAEQGSSDAQFFVGVFFHKGQGFVQNDAEAVKWYLSAAEQGHADAQSNLGVMYVNGRGVPVNYVEAYKWFSLSAATGISEARDNRERVEKIMTREQIAEAQRLSAEWKPNQ